MIRPDSRLPLATALGSALVATTLLAACDGSSESHAASPLRVNGSTTVNPVVADAAELLRAEDGLTILVDTQGGSSGGITALGEGRVEVGMASKPLAQKDRERFPDVDFVEHRIGEDAVALVVSADVWEGGVRSISREEMRGVYEGRITNWSRLGGPDLRLVFFNKEPGRGTWEVFAKWLYGGGDEAPAVSFPEVGGNEETRNKVASTPGAMSQLSYSWADRETVFPLALEVDGKEIEPSPSTIATHAYPMSRPLFLLTDGPPSGDARALLELILSPRGQELVRDHGYLGVDQLAQ